MSEALDLDVRNAEPATDEGAGLLAAQLANARVREAFKRAEQASTMGTRNGAGADLECCLCGAVIVVREGSDRKSPEPHYPDCHFAALSAPSPALAELRELMAAVKVEIDEWIKSGDGDGGPGYPPERLGAAYAAVLAAHPYLK